MKKVQVGIVLNSREAFDAYHEATGKVPPPMEPGKNTRRIFFRLNDGDGVELAALLIHQTGFEQTKEEREADEEVNGLMLAVAIDAPADEGEATLKEWSERMLWPNKTEKQEQED